jgi:hypothetical protein
VTGNPFPIARLEDVKQARAHHIHAHGHAGNSICGALDEPGKGAIGCRALVHMRMGSRSRTRWSA